MSCSLSVTRKKESEHIAFDEWLSLVSNDVTLSLDGRPSNEFAVWANPKDSEGYYELQWFEGSISSDVTSNSVIAKLLEIAETFDGIVVDDGGNRYTDDSGYPVNWKPPS